jgi:outer membrane receptor protein involved in Fe transport
MAAERNGTRRAIDGIEFSRGNPRDLDQIPTALIERVEVLTGGASATYGSDAVAGVVNSIMKRKRRRARPTQPTPWEEICPAFSPADSSG